MNDDLLLNISNTRFLVKPGNFHLTFTSYACIIKNKIKSRRLQKAGDAKWSWRNQMLWFVALPILFAGTLGLVFGWKATLFFKNH